MDDDLSNSIINIDIEIESSRQNIEDSFQSHSQSIKFKIDTNTNNLQEDSILEDANSNKLETNKDNRPETHDSFTSYKNRNLGNNQVLHNSNTLFKSGKINIQNSLDSSVINKEDDKQANINNHIESINYTSSGKTDQDQTGKKQHCFDFQNKNRTEALDKAIINFENSSKGLNSNYGSIRKNDSEEVSESISNAPEEEKQQSKLNIEVNQIKNEAQAEPDILIKNIKKFYSKDNIDDHGKTPEKNSSPNIFETIKNERIEIISKKLAEYNKYILKLIRKNEFSHIHTSISYQEYHIYYQKNSSSIDNIIVPLNPLNNDQIIELENNLKFPIGSIFEFLSNFFRFAKAFRNVINPSLTYATNYNIFLLFIIRNKLSSFNLSQVKDINLLELRLKDSLKEIKIDDVVYGIKNYVEFLLKDFSDTADEKLLQNFSVAFGSLCGTNLDNIKNSMLHEQINTIKHMCLEFCTNKLNTKRDLQDRDLTITNFHKVFINLKNYFFEFFPSCCGIEKISKKVKNTKSNNLVLCIKCKILSCSKCLKYHKGHRSFHFKSFDYENIQSDEFFVTILENFSKTEGKEKKSEDINSSENSFKSILDFLELFLYEYFLKNFLTKNFEYSKKYFLKDKNLVGSVFSIINKQKNFSFSNENIDRDNIFITIVEEYKKLIYLEKFSKKQNNNLLEELFINNLSTELNVNKFLLSSNPDLNYDVSSNSTTNDLILTISQTNSLNEFYRDNILKTKKEISPQSLFEKHEFKKNKIASGHSVFNKFSTDFKIDKNIKTQGDVSECDLLDLKITQNILRLKNNLSANVENNRMFLNILEKINKEDSLNKFFTRIDPSERTSMDAYDSEFKFKDQFVPKLDVVIIFLEDWINKVCTIGVPVLK